MVDAPHDRERLLRALARNSLTEAQAAGQAYDEIIALGAEVDALKAELAEREGSFVETAADVAEAEIAERVREKLHNLMALSDTCKNTPSRWVRCAERVPAKNGWCNIIFLPDDTHSRQTVAGMSYFGTGDMSFGITGWATFDSEDGTVWYLEKSKTPTAWLEVDDMPDTSKPPGSPRPSLLDWFRGLWRKTSTP